ncbi:hypothetical protein D9V32_00330 [Mycetocola tolaasinivorans]|uniref:HTH luxR-type domain-containing protein n=1 Tax=Mycetocola tolaasinivorans TaxID=76635 RepID=A0A3L7ADM6_9MICO|nr:helix-turn-helix transcriptional regulator [Mycetocola tolaasinivorans]RLP77818.1 hypothetical protein D9V32_00330 [Mycetocola tolaasinivorans]
MLRHDTWVAGATTNGFVLDDIVSESFGHLRDGRSVRLVGDAGSGRSSVLEKCIELVEATGREVLVARGEPAAQLEPGYGLQQLGLTVAGRTPNALVDMFSRELSSSGPTVIAIDDAAYLDTLSLRVIETVRMRTGIPLIRVERGHDAARTGFRPYWPEAEVSIPTLRLDQVGLVVAAILHGPVELSTITRVLTVSGGNPRFIRAIMDLAQRRGTVRLQNGRWSGQLPLFDNELAHLVEAHVGHEPQVRSALRWLAAHGPLPAPEAERELGFEIIEDLRGRGYLVDLPSDHDTSEIHVWPPLVQQLFSPSHAPISDVVDGQLVNVQESSREAELVTADAALSRHFEFLSASRMAKSYAIWRQSPTARSAVLYLSDAMAHASENARVETVLAHTRMADSNQVHASLLRAMAYQWWTIDRGRQDRADALRAESDDAALDAVFLVTRAFRGCMPTEQETAMLWDNAVEPSGVVATCLAILRIFEADLPGARDAIRVGRDSTLIQLWGKHIELLMRMLGPEAPSLRETVDRARDEAVADLSREGYAIFSYIVALDLELRGHTREQRSVLSSVAAMGRPGRLGRYFFDASMTMLKRNTITDDFRAGVRMPIEGAREILAGPLPWVGNRWEALGIFVGETPEEADTRIAADIDRLMQGRSYLSATHIAAYGTALLGRGECSSLLSQLCREHPVLRYALIGSFATALDAGPIAVASWVEEHPSFEGEYLVERALATYLKTNPDRLDSAELDRLGRLVAARTIIRKQERVVLASLTGREREIARLAGSLSNQEIADRLRLSQRTVENYISQALRKTGCKNRVELSEAVLLSGH